MFDITLETRRNPFSSKVVLGAGTSAMVEIPSLILEDRTSHTLCTNLLSSHQKEPDVFGHVPVRTMCDNTGAFSFPRFNYCQLGQTCHQFTGNAW